MSHTDLLAQFQAISGKNESLSKSFLNTAGWNLELALSNYFGSGDYAPPDETTLMDTAPPPSSTPILQPMSTIVVPPVPVIDDNSKIGLFVKNSDVEVPLVALSVRADVVDLAAEVEVGQRFVNNTESPMEALFIFQQEDCTIFDLQVEVDGKVITAVCKEKEEAFSHYDDSISSGHNAFLLEKVESGKDEFKLNVGNLAPGQEATVLLKYVTELQPEGDALKFSLPITRVPIVAAKSTTTTTTTTTTKPIPEGLSVTVHVKGVVPILGIEPESPHAIDAKIDGTTAVVTYSTATTTTHSFETLRFLIGFAESLRPRMVLEAPAGLSKEESKGEEKEAKVESEEESALMVSFYPRIKEAVKAAMPEGEWDEEAYQPFCEVIFLVDRSGSMAGSRINQAKNALHLFLRSLPEGTQFNIYGFGSSFVKLFPSSVEYSDKTFRSATDHVNAVDASLGGTDILPPLRDILQQGANPDYPRQLFVLTDGDVTNTSEVLEYIRKNGGGTRIFTFGIGADASPTLVQGMAKAGRGEAEFVASGTRLEPKVLRQLQRAMQPILKNARVEWGEKLQGRVTQCPPVLPPLFEGERLVLYALVAKGVGLDDLRGARVAIHAQTADQDSRALVFPLEFDEHELVLVDQGRTLAHRLAAAEMIRHLSGRGDRETSKSNKEEIVRLGVRYGIASEFTSLVAVNERREAVGGTLRQVDTNIALHDRIVSKGIVDSGMVLDTELDADFGGFVGAPYAGGGGGSFGGYAFGSAPQSQSYHHQPQQTHYHHQQVENLWGHSHTPVSSKLINLLDRDAPAPAPTPAPAPVAVDPCFFDYRPVLSSSATTPQPATTRPNLALLSPQIPAMEPTAKPTTPTSDPFADLLGGQQQRPPPPPSNSAPTNSAPLAKEKLLGLTMPGAALPQPSPAAGRGGRGLRSGSLLFEEEESRNRPQAPTREEGNARQGIKASLFSLGDDFAFEAAPAWNAQEESEDEDCGLDDLISAPAESLKRQRASSPSSTMGAPLQPVKVVTHAHMRPLDRLVQLQQFDGSWALSADIAELCGAKAGADAVRAAAPQALRDSDALWATVLAVVLLELSFADAKEEWKLLAAKATKWVKAQLRKVHPSVAYNELVGEATSALKTWAA